MSAADILKKPVNPLTILHTSDWHLGRRLYGRMRYEEFEAFLKWLEETISAQKVDVLIVAGDIFDTMTPSNKAQAIYYEFLGRVSRSCCEHIVIVAGNHDSPTFLDAPSNVLKFLNVHVIGTACDNLNDEVLLLNDANNAAQCIIAAVPYLRDRDVRSSTAGESTDTKDANVIKGIRAHYDEVARIAKEKQSQLMTDHQRHVPIIATGHLFAAGGTTTDDDGVRDLYVGSLGKISADMFDDCFDYVALGHLHVPQRVGGREHIRYSGSPIAMGFGEARQQKQILLIQFGEHLPEHDHVPEHDAAINTSADTTAEISDSDSSSKEPKNNEKTAKQANVQTNAQANLLIDDLFGFDDFEADINTDRDELKIDTFSDATTKTSADMTRLHHNAANTMQVLSLHIPCFQKLAQVSGDLRSIEKTIQSIEPTIDPITSIWLEVIYDGDEIVHELREEINAMIKDRPYEVLKIKNTRTYNKVLNQEQTSETLQDLNELDVFDRCLEVNDIASTQKPSLRDAYQQILHNIYDDDSQAE